MSQTGKNPTAAMVVIGDEILSGRTRDANMHHLARELGQAGIALREARVIADDEDAIVAAIRALSPVHDHVFTSGGIGPTHDDITADSIARAMNVPIGIREDAKALLESYFADRGVEATPARMRMARIPEGATLIDNPVSVAPGFTIGNVHVLAGVPQIFEAMLAGLLPRLAGGAPIMSQSLRVDRPEGEIAPALAALAAEFSDLSMGSYPFHHPDGSYGTNIVVRGRDGARIDAAMLKLAEAFGTGG